MRITKGIREPPEHGLKKWHRENPRKSTKSFSEETDPGLTDANLTTCFGQTETVEQVQESDPKQQVCYVLKLNHSCQKNDFFNYISLCLNFYKFIFCRIN